MLLVVACYMMLEIEEIPEAFDMLLQYVTSFAVGIILQMFSANVAMSRCLQNLIFHVPCNNKILPKIIGHAELDYFLHILFLNLATVVSD